MSFYMRRYASLLAVAVPFLSFAPSAVAQSAQPPPAAAQPAAPTSDQRALAEMLFFTARGLMEAGRVPQACQKFGESYRLDAAAGTLLNLAVCHEKEGKLASAWGEFRQAIAEAKRANRQERVELATEAVKRIEPDLPFVTITVAKEARVQGLEIQRNGTALEEAAWDTELPIDPGTNEITATAPLYKPEKKTITIEKRQHMTVTIDPLELAPVIHAPPPFWTSQRVLGTVLMVVGVAGIGVGTGFGVAALNNKSSSDNQCKPFDGVANRCTQGGVDAMNSAQTDAWVSDFGLIGGGIALVAGGILFATGGGHHERSPVPVGAPPKEALASPPSWSFDVRTSAHGAQGMLTHSF